MGLAMISIPTELMQKAPLKHAAMLSLLRNHAGERDFACVATSTMAEELGWSRGVVMRTLAQLCSIGKVIKEERFVAGTKAHRSNVYRLAEGVMEIFRRAIAKIRGAKPVEKSVNAGDKSVRRTDSVQTNADSGRVQLRGEGKEIRPEPSHARSEAPRPHVDRIKKSVSDAYRAVRRGLNGGTLDAEERRQRRISKLMLAAKQLLGQADWAAFYAIFMEAPLEDQRRAMDRLEIICSGAC